MDRIKVLFTYFPRRPFLVLLGGAVLALVAGLLIAQWFSDACRVAATLAAGPPREMVTLWLWVAGLFGGVLYPVVRQWRKRSYDYSEMAADIVIISAVNFALYRVYFDALRYAVCAIPGWFG